ncbi:MAG: xanthine dehydrogenase small subunit [Anaeromyxobacter sp.]|nr:xanthine dehydrogenase small subunit [Anaeromyxobacter sp.]
MDGSGIRFILDGQVRELDGVDPTLTVLRWLREVEGRSGTKEGCAEGDCGACTVVLVELRGGELRYRALNACLLFLPALDGAALLTVESLCREGQPLHPVQDALVRCHASQCGFCTPGFVMSLTALYESEVAPSRQRLDEVLAGNLCRCTGYRPIVEAARLACAGGQVPRLAAQQAALRAQLEGLARTEGLALRHGGRRWFAPRSLAEAARLAEAHPAAHLVAGATDVGLWVTKQRRALDTVIALGGVPELTAVSLGATHVEVGAAASYTDALGPLEAEHPDLGRLLRRIGSQQIRNAGTLGGNLANASPIGDTAPALLALDASVVLRRGQDTRELPLAAFFAGYRRTALRPGELLERIRVPRRAPGLSFRAYKVAKRFDQDISTVCGAFALVLERGRVAQVRVAFGGMAATPVRVDAVERALLGLPWTLAAVEQVVPLLDQALAPLSDLRGSATYRRLVAGNLLRKFQLETGGEAPATRLRAGAEGR